MSPSCSTSARVLGASQPPPVRQSLALSVLAGALLTACVDTPSPAGPESEPIQAGECPTRSLLGMPVPVSPVWCLTLGNGPATFVRGNNTWRDDFDHGLSLAELGDGYLRFDRAPAFSPGCSVRHFRHNDHWMVDLGTDGCDGTLMRPDAAFRFENGRLVVESMLAASIESYGPRVWGEIVVTNAPAPTATSNGELYAYTMFPDSWSFGCRLEAGRTPVCALFDDRGLGTGGSRVMEISFFQHEGAAQVYGGEPGPPGGERDRAWRTCGTEDPDLTCRDRFRLELERDAIRLYVNGTLYMAHTGFPAAKQLPDELLNGEVYVYLASWSWRLGEVAPGARFHWDEIAVNP